MDELLAALGRSTFRARFRLRGADLAYLRGRGWDVVLRHAHEMIAARLAPAHPLNDGKQTPMRGHPVFVAQHATATCCRGCLAKWHRIPRGREMTAPERAHVVAVLERWLRIQDAAAPAEGHAVRSTPPSDGARSTPSADDPQMGLDLG